MSGKQNLILSQTQNAYPFPRIVIILPNEYTFLSLSSQSWCAWWVHFKKCIWTNTAQTGWDHVKTFVFRLSFQWEEVKHREIFIHLPQGKKKKGTKMLFDVNKHFMEKP